MKTKDTKASHSTITLKFLVIDLTPEYSRSEAVAVKLWVPTSCIATDNNFKSEPTIDKNVACAGEIV